MTTMEFSGKVEKMRELSPREFEEFIADVWQECQGWNTEVMDPGRDRGLDVIGEPPNGGSKTAVQCKRYSPSNKVTSNQVQQYSALRQQWQDVTGVTIVTTSSFTKAARELADNLGVKCIDENSLERIVDTYHVDEILDWYLAGKPEDW